MANGVHFPRSTLQLVVKMFSNISVPGNFKYILTLSLFVGQKCSYSVGKRIKLRKTCLKEKKVSILVYTWPLWKCTIWDSRLDKEQKLVYCLSLFVIGSQPFFGCFFIYVLWKVLNHQKVSNKSYRFMVMVP